MRDGHAESGFDAYCRAGFRFRAPHWLFQEMRYRQRYPDLRDEVLAPGGNANGYDHFLKHGSREGRIGHILFDPGVYRACLGADERVGADAVGGYLHYLPRMWERRAETATSHHFDPIWYLRHYPTVAEAIAAGPWLCALHHYLANDTPTAFDPLPEFSEAYYRSLQGCRGGGRGERPPQWLRSFPDQRHIGVAVTERDDRVAVLLCVASRGAERSGCRSCA